MKNKVKIFIILTNLTFAFSTLWSQRVEIYWTNESNEVINGENPYGLNIKIAKMSPILIRKIQEGQRIYLAEEDLPQKECQTIFNLITYGGLYKLVSLPNCIFFLTSGGVFKSAVKLLTLHLIKFYLIKPPAQRYKPAIKCAQKLLATSKRLQLKIFTKLLKGALQSLKETVTYTTTRMEKIQSLAPLWQEEELESYNHE